MPQRVRHAHALALAVAALTLALHAARPGPLLALGDGADAFPAELAVTAAPVPDAHRDAPDVRVLQLLASMDAMWARAFAAEGKRYEPPRIETRTRRATSGCGATATGWAGIYCSDGARIVIDLGDHLVVRAAVGDREADDRLGYVLAHEVGHHVQALRGRLRPDDVVRVELEAQCLAGVWGRAAGRAAPPAWGYGTDAEHGSAAEQRRWLEAGHASGRPATCDAVWGPDG